MFSRHSSLTGLCVSDAGWPRGQAAAAGRGGGGGRPAHCQRNLSTGRDPAWTPQHAGPAARVHRPPDGEHELSLESCDGNCEIIFLASKPVLPCRIPKTTSALLYRMLPGCRAWWTASPGCRTCPGTSPASPPTTATAGWAGRRRSSWLEKSFRK